MFYLWFVIIALATLALVPVARRIGRDMHTNEVLSRSYMEKLRELSE